jgi:hypothetical protein
LFDEADARYGRVLRSGEETGEPELIVLALEGLARLAARGGDQEAATTLSGRAAARRARTHRPAPPHEQI